MKVIIAGGRDFNDYSFFEKCMGELNLEITEVVSGMAKGADSLGIRWAEGWVDVKEFPADWEQYGKAAGHIRNQQMSQYGDVLVAFWDGRSTGTKSMIEKMVQAMKPVHIYFYRGKK